MTAAPDPRPPTPGAPGVPAARVTVRYWAAARDVAGVREETIEADTLAALFTTVAARHGGDLPALLRRCSYLVDDQPVGRRDPAGVVLRDGAVVEALPPFAGG
ncbi:molybdopterin converting factor, small subunit [Frankia torreyi]|uniref:Molybdopterin synthase sulfur carrier subunit n=1 Tax=Frankia torreyi TaxID=1856 RepID=A0A0D8BGR2_9ACTN|nr:MULTISPECIES: MoaD/ThiS family protein [Frankia]KJE23174.1 molybdopterin converting factor, small subunit [Frankia torreyi]KQM06477.1 molybdopterin converting factor, small subunit [Frankia sp. CpI1-P]